MHFYILTEPADMANGAVAKHVEAAPSLADCPTHAIQMCASGECDAVQHHLKQLHGVESIDDRVRIVADVGFAHWPHFPVRIGRNSLNLVGIGTEFLHEDESEPLIGQLQVLRARFPDKSHFRIAIINGFGTNLGDNLLGATAFRTVLEVLHRYLPSFSCDLLLGVANNPEIASFFRTMPEVGNVRRTGLSLAEFGIYDAYFDFSYLLNYPRFFEMPTVDFCLWWMGLDPQSIPASQKRNTIAFSYASWHSMKNMVAPAQGRKILFCHRSSVPLRTFPVEIARQFVGSLLEAHPDITVLITHTLELDHPRLLNLDGKIANIDMLNALIAQVDGVITVDTFPLHITDTAAIPTVLLSSSIPLTNLTSYYPYVAGLLVPGAEELPAWKKAKTSDAEWAEMAPRYIHAWSLLKADEVMGLLQEKIQQREALLPTAPPRYNFTASAQKPAPVEVQQSAEGRPDLKPRYLVTTPLEQQSSNIVIKTAMSFLYLGCTMVQCGAGAGDVSLAVAQSLGADGKVHVFEPRQSYFRILCARMLLAGLASPKLYQELPFVGAGGERFLEIDEVDLLSPHAESFSGNAHTKTRVACRQIDELQLPICRLLTVQPPLPFREVLNGALDTLKRCRPIVMAIPFPYNQAAMFSDVFNGLDYRLWCFRQLPALPDGQPSACFVAVPQEIGIRFENFETIEISPT